MFLGLGVCTPGIEPVLAGFQFSNHRRSPSVSLAFRSANQKPVSVSVPASAIFCLWLDTDDASRTSPREVFRFAGKHRKGGGVMLSVLSIDAYTKVVLTIIAIALSVIAAKSARLRFPWRRNLLLRTFTLNPGLLLFELLMGALKEKEK